MYSVKKTKFQHSWTIVGEGVGVNRQVHACLVPVELGRNVRQGKGECWVVGKEVGCRGKASRDRGEH